MTSHLILLMLLCSVSHVLCQSSHDDHDDDSRDADTQHRLGGGMDWGRGGRGRFPGRGGWPNAAVEGFVGEPQLCIAFFNVQVNRTTYPNCPDPNVCPRNCGFTTSWWRGRSRWSCTRDSCCGSVVPVTMIETRNMSICCPGYTNGRWGRCDKPICMDKCSDTKTTCVAPNTCGPACYPPCLNGGTCQTGTSANTCTCASGWTGPTCAMAVQCTTTGDNACRNGGSCSFGFCRCPSDYFGILCDKARCQQRCLNDGMCTAPDTCQCVNGFTGDNCEVAPAGSTP